MRKRHPKTGARQPNYWYRGGPHGGADLYKCGHGREMLAHYALRLADAERFEAEALGDGWYRSGSGTRERRL